VLNVSCCCGVTGLPFWPFLKLFAWHKITWLSLNVEENSDLASFEKSLQNLLLFTNFRIQFGLFHFWTWQPCGVNHFRRKKTKQIPSEKIVLDICCQQITWLQDKLGPPKEFFSKLDNIGKHTNQKSLYFGSLKNQQTDGNLKVGWFLKSNKIYS